MLVIAARIPLEFHGRRIPCQTAIVRVNVCWQRPRKSLLMSKLFLTDASAMPSFDCSHQKLPSPIAIRVETRTWVDVDTSSNRNSHGPSTFSTVESPSQSHHPDLSPPQSTTRWPSLSTMSLPRSDYDPRRVFVNPFPEISLGKHRRIVGVYLAGALVSTIIMKTCIKFKDECQVRVSQLDIPGCCCPVCSCTCSMGPTRNTAACACNIRRLDTRHLLSAGLSGYQPH